MPKPPDNDPYDAPRRPRGKGATHAARSGSGPERGAGGGSGRGADGGSGRGAGSRGERPYNTYSSRPRGLIARLRGESDMEIEARDQQRAPRRAAADRGAGAGANRGAGASTEAGGPPGGFGGPGGRFGGPGGWRGGRAGRGIAGPPTGRLRFLRHPLFGLVWLTPLRLIRWFVLLVIGWVLLSLVLFFVSASDHAGSLPAGAKSALHSSGPILTSANTVLILGLDNRPTTGYSSKEGGASHSEKDARTDTIMLWRIGGGVSRRLSIPRDTLVDIPGYGENKINAAWYFGGPKLAIHTIEHLIGVPINHLIVVDLGNFPKFINDIGGVTVRTPHICSNISGGRKNGGFSLYLKPGVHHLDGYKALTLARTRDNSCDPAYTDLNREKMQQEIMNSIKSQLFTLHTFMHLPWAAWDAPGTIQTDMGGLSLMQLFIASEIGGSAKPQLLSETSGTYDGEDVLVPNTANVRAQVRRLMSGK